MKKRDVGLVLLLGGALCIGAVVGLFRGLAREIELNTSPLSIAALGYKNAQEPVAEDIVKLLHPLFVSRNLGMLAATVSQFSPHMICSLASIIICDKRVSMTNEDKLSFLFMLAYRNNMSKFIQSRLFSLMVKMQLFNAHSPALLGSAKKDYLAVLPSFLSWIQREKEMVVLPIKEQLLIDDALYGAIEQDDLCSLEWLNACGMRIDSQKASELLVHVVYDRKKSNFIPFLVNRGADVNRIGPDRHTLLSKAICQNDSITARTLLEAGADLDLRADEVIGSARQIASVKGNPEIERLITMYGTKG